MVADLMFLHHKDRQDRRATAAQFRINQGHICQVTGWSRWPARVSTLHRRRDEGGMGRTTEIPLACNKVRWHPAAMSILTVPLLFPTRFFPHPPPAPFPLALPNCTSSYSPIHSFFIAGRYIHHSNLLSLFPLVSRCFPLQEYTSLSQTLV